MGRSTNATLPSFLSKLRKNKNDNTNNAMMARTRMLTLNYGEKETVKILPNSYSVSLFLTYNGVNYHHPPSSPTGPRGLGQKLGKTSGWRPLCT